jgi:hypothetical protein
MCDWMRLLLDIIPSGELEAECCKDRHGCSACHGYVELDGRRLEWTDEEELKALVRTAHCVALGLCVA